MPSVCILVLPLNTNLVMFSPIVDVIPFSIKELRARVSDIFLNLSLKAIDISGVSMVVIDGLKCFMDLNLPLQTTFLAEVPLAKSLTGVLKICGQICHCFKYFACKKLYSMHPMLSDEEVTVTRCRLLKSPTSMIVIQQILDSPLHHSSFSSEAKKDSCAAELMAIRKKSFSASASFFIKCSS
nr:uncharacterized protein LOC9270769 isoform X1 [Oryza sativa Japonica Group]XP_025877225.1 uncharacterized protein LOC9270769 isoform X1 [Oryza sativa Japonica Group]